MLDSSAYPPTAPVDAFMAAALVPLQGVSDIGSLARAPCLVDEVPIDACPIRVALVALVADLKDAHGQGTAWLNRANASLPGSAGTPRLTLRRAYRCADEALSLAIALFSVRSTARPALDVDGLVNSGRIHNQATALNAHKALKRLQRTQSIAGWHLFAYEAALVAVGSSRMASHAPSTVLRLGQLAAFSLAVAPDRDEAAARLLSRMTCLEAELAAMAEDTVEVPQPVSYRIAA